MKYLMMLFLSTSIVAPAFADDDVSAPVPENIAKASLARAPIAPLAASEGLEAAAQENTTQSLEEVKTAEQMAREAADKKAALAWERMQKLQKEEREKGSIIDESLIIKYDVDDDSPSVEKHEVIETSPKKI